MRPGTTGSGRKLSLTSREPGSHASFEGFSGGPGPSPAAQHSSVRSGGDLLSLADVVPRRLVGHRGPDTASEPAGDREVGEDRPLAVARQVPPPGKQADLSAEE